MRGRPKGAQKSNRVDPDLPDGTCESLRRSAGATLLREAIAGHFASAKFAAAKSQFTRRSRNASMYFGRAFR